MKTLAANKTVIANAVSTTEEVTMNPMINNTMDVTPMQDLTLDFTSFYTEALPEDVSEKFEVLRAEAIEKHGFTVAQRAERALSVIMLHSMIEEVGGKDSWLGEQLFNLAVSNTHWWGNVVSGEKVTHGRRFQDALIAIMGKDHPSITLFKNTVKFVKDYKIDINDAGVSTLYQVVGNEKVVVKEFPASPVKLSLQRTGVKVLVKAGSEITPIKGQKFVFGKTTASVFGLNTINAHLESVLKSIRIHNEYTRVEDKDLYEHSVKSFTKEAYKFNKEDALVILLLLKENNVDVQDLFTNVKNGKDKTLVLSRDEGSKKVKSLHRIVAPAFSFPEKYAMSGVTSLNDAKQGYIVPMVTIPRLVEFTKDREGFDIVISRENVNKTINRFDKLDNAKSLWTTWVNVFVVADATTHEELNKALVGGNILVPDSFLISNGVCRVVTDMDNGGIKASTTPFQSLDKNLAKGDTCVISSAGFKGGMLSALGMAYGNIDGVKNLFGMIDGSAQADAVVEGMRKAVLGAMTTMIIGGEEVTGVRLTVELKITNAYTIDSLMRAATSQADITSTDEQARVKRSVEAMLEEMDTESKASNGLRAYVAEQKAASSDLFSVQEWMAKGLADGTLVRKPLITKIIAQEIQSIAHWYGKKTAIAFLNQALENQADNGFSIDKLYAVQYLGAVEREINKEVSVQDIVEVLQRSTYKIQADSAVYTKDTMKELLALLGNDVYGWTNIVYQDGTKVALPVGRILVADIEDQMENDKAYVVAKGLINDLLENVKGMIKEDGTLYETSTSHMVLKALIQKPLLGKNFGYQYTKGYYGVALPMLGNYGVSTAGITNRSRMIKDDATWTTMTLSKAPQYFKGMTASYNVLNMDFGKELNMVLECAVFVNVEIVLMHQNDFDGDMYRITLGDSLPFVETIYDEFNGNFFKDFYEGELAGNSLSIKKSQMCYLNEYHEAVHNAILAKGHIGSYTANSYYYEAMLSNMIGKTFEGVTGNEITVSEQDAYEITSIMKMLIQIEAMDNVKQEGSSTYITEMLMHYKLRNIKGYNGKSDERAVKDHLNALTKSLLSLVDSKDMALSKEDIVRFVQIMFHTAKSYDSKATTALNLFNARNVEEKALANITAFLAGEDYNDIYDFENSYESIINGIDTESMYFEIIIATVEALSGNDIAIRV